MMAVLIVVFAVIARLLPHLPNFTPLGAAALFGGTYLNKKWALLLPIIAMVISDFFIGFDNILSRTFVYGSFLGAGLIGMWLRNHKNVKNTVLAAFGGSLLFFLVTNFGVWAFSEMYPKTFLGLATSYLMGIPFYRNTLIGDLFYTGILFGSYELATYYISKLKYVPTTA